jgi:hypothetical protein
MKRFLNRPSTAAAAAGEEHEIFPVVEMLTGGPVVEMLREFKYDKVLNTWTGSLTEKDR